MCVDRACKKRGRKVRKEKRQEEGKEETKV